ncbi:hypothetical protein BH20VER1_BH20VER1_17790 [soil metagenome]
MIEVGSLWVLQKSFGVVKPFFDEVPYEFIGPFTPFGKNRPEAAFGAP